MALETATYISQLVKANPVSGDNVSVGDDHIRLIKSVLKNSFPLISGPLTCTNTEINFITGVTASIQTQFNTLSSQVGEPYTWATKTTNYQAVIGDALLCDTSGGAFTVTLPLSPTVGNTVRIVDIAGTFETYNLTIARNGQEINNLSEDMILDISDVSVMFVYTGSSYGWRAV